MAYNATLNRFRKDEPFHHTKDSKFLGQPVFPKGLLLENPSCSLCGSSLQFLMQVAMPRAPNLARILYIYFCPTHIMDSAQWRCYRYRKEVPRRNPTLQGPMDTSLETTMDTWMDTCMDELSISPKTGPEPDSFKLIFEEEHVLNTASADDPTQDHVNQLLVGYIKRGMNDLDEEDIRDHSKLFSGGKIDYDSDYFSEEEEESRMAQLQRYLSQHPSVEG